MLLWLNVRAFRVALFCWLTTNLTVAAVLQKQEAKPNVFLITIDTVRADHIHCYGYERIETPAIDGLAEDGILFAQAFTPSPITNTSHTSILTGLLPSSHGVTDFAVPLSTAHTTWAELLHQQGYHTAAFIGAVILDSKDLAPGLDRGFDFYDNFPKRTQTKSRWGRIERRGLDVVQRAETWLSAHPRGPHFIWVHLYDPHDPYEPPAPYSNIYKDRLYDGEIAYADSAIANFINYLKKNHWYENSLIVVVGDHGEGLGEHQEDTHGIFLYDSTTHVPLIVKPPSQAGVRKKVVEAQVRTTDILPTVLDVTRMTAPPKLDGESLKSYFTRTDVEAVERTVLGETDYPLRFGWAPLRSVRMHGLKFIEAPRPELYDLRQDPSEVKNQYEPWNPNVQKARGILAAIRAQAPPLRDPKASIGQGTINELKALGYLGGADSASATNVPEPSLLPDPKDEIEAQNLLHRALMAAEDGRDTAAREFLKKVLQLDPKSHTALRQLGELELRAGDYKESAKHLKVAFESHPDDAEAAFDEGKALEKMHDLGGAREALEAGLKLMPGQVEARLLLGRVYLGLNDFASAEDQFTAALLLQPDSIEGELGVAKAQILRGNFNDAAQQLNAFSKLRPRNAEVFELLAQAYAGLGDEAKARQAEARAKILRRAK